MRTLISIHQKIIRSGTQLSAKRHEVVPGTAWWFFTEDDIASALVAVDEHALALEAELGG